MFGTDGLPKICVHGVLTHTGPNNSCGSNTNLAGNVEAFTDMHEPLPLVPS